jgi:PAS domain S-box-containing protein
VRFVALFGAAALLFLGAWVVGYLRLPECALAAPPAQSVTAETTTTPVGEPSRILTINLTLPLLLVLGGDFLRRVKSCASFASLRVRLLLLVLVAVVPILGLMVYTNGELRRRAAADAEGEALRLARIAASDQRDMMKDARQLLFALAQLPEVHDGNPEACSTLLARLLEQYPQYVVLGVIAPDGTLLCSTPPPADAADFAGRDFFRHLLQGRTFAIGDYADSSFGGERTLDFGYPIFEESGQVRAVLFASLSLNWLRQLATEAQLPPGSTFTLIDENGTILVRYPDPEEQIELVGAEAPIGQRILAQGGGGTAKAPGVDGVLRLFAFTPIFGPSAREEMYVTIGIPAEVAFADANRTLTRNLVGLGLVAGLALTLAWFGGDAFILRRVTRLVEVTKRMAEGELDVRIGLPAQKGGLGQLAKAFDEMAEALEKRIAERDQVAEALRESQRALSTLMSNLPGMAYRRRNDEGWTMEFVSEGCLDLTGHRPSELVENRETAYAQLVHPQDREAVRNAVQTALAERQPFQSTYRIVTQAGEEKWAWEQGRGVYSPGGDLVALEGFVTDATERVLAQQILEQQVADRTRQLQALYDVMTAAGASLDLPTVLESSLAQVLKVMRSKVGAIHLLNEDGETLYMAVSQGVTQDDLGPERTVPIGDGLVGWVVEHGSPVVIPSLRDSPRPLLALPTSGTQGYVGVPVCAGGQVVGVLSVIGESGRCFSQAEVSLLVSIADEVGVAVENARRHEQAQELAVVRERERLARELHDSVTQSLYSLTLLAEAGLRLIGAGDLERVGEYLSRLGEIAQQALKEMRLLVYQLRPLVLKREGLVGALQERLDAVEKRAGVDARLLVEGPVALPAFVEDELYRIAQEALTNALKHAAPTQVRVTIRSIDNRVSLEVQDNGRGFDPQSAGREGGMGLVSIRERAEKLGGSFAVVSRPGEGTTVRVDLEVS